MVAATDILHGFLKWEQCSTTVFFHIRYADLIAWIVELVLRVCAVLIFEIESEW